MRIVNRLCFLYLHSSSNRGRKESCFRFGGHADIINPPSVSLSVEGWHVGGPFSGHMVLLPLLLPAAATLWDKSREAEQARAGQHSRHTWVLILAPESPLATIMTGHKLGALRQHTGILLQFWSLEVQSQFYWANIKVLVWLVSSGGSGRIRRLGFSSFWRSPGFFGSWSLPCITPTSCFCLRMSYFYHDNFPWPSPYKCSYHGAQLHNPEYSPCSRSLDSLTCKFLLSHKGACRFRGSRTWM